MDPNRSNPRGWRGYPWLDLIVLGIGVVAVVCGWFLLMSSRPIPTDVHLVATSAMAIYLLRLSYRLSE